VGRQRHLRAVSEEHDAFDALRYALRAAISAPDLESALDAIARCLVSAVGAHTAVVVVSGPGGAHAEAEAGSMEATEALHLAVHSEEGGDDDVVIRYIGLSANFGFGAPQGAVLVVLPTATAARDGANTAEIVQAFAELAELCVIHAQRLRQVERHSDDDALTLCLTRRAIEQSLTAELARSNRTQVPFSIAFLDIDDFKRVNDDQGHVRGDAVLSAVGSALLQTSRATDFVGRYGGDEFLVVMPATDAESAVVACDRLATGVTAALVQAELPELRLSYGTATWTAGEGATELIEQADRAMFAAKRAGRG
jgi:diguanylate cyclase (GGDEF)-like protein